MFSLVPDLNIEETYFYNPHAPNGMKSGQRSWYHESSRGSNALLITAGDSWTWGDSLNPERSTGRLYRDYNEHRLANIYGTVLASNLDCDHINLAKCGGSNREIHDLIARVLPSVLPKYDTVLVVVTLTENCREWSTHYDWPIRQRFDHRTLDEMLQEWEALCFDKFATLFSQSSKIKALLARNFTHSYDANLQTMRHLHADKIWTQILDCDTETKYPAPVRMLSMASYVPFEKFLLDNNLLDQWKPEILEIFWNMSKAIHWLDKSKYNYKFATRHPNEQAHRLWAQYLRTVLIDKYQI